MKNCKFCQSQNLVKYGKANNSQRYLCKECKKVQINGDLRSVHSNKIKKLAIILYLEGNRFRRIARILNEIFKDSKISFQIVNYWIKNARSFVEKEVAKKRQELESSSNNKTELAVVEMDELYTYIKKTSQK